MSNATSDREHARLASTARTGAITTSLVFGVAALGVAAVPALGPLLPGLGLTVGGLGALVTARLDREHRLEKTRALAARTPDADPDRVQTPAFTADVGRPLTLVPPALGATTAISTGFLVGHWDAGTATLTLVQAVVAIALTVMAASSWSERAHLVTRASDPLAPTNEGSARRGRSWTRRLARRRRERPAQDA